VLQQFRHARRVAPAEHDPSGTVQRDPSSCGLHRLPAWQGPEALIRTDNIRDMGKSIGNPISMTIDTDHPSPRKMTHARGRSPISSHP
jgi:hypothetical protein